ncbi:MAG TPA: hypothetical protein VF875_05630 [Anaeromyxobacter sp.]
MESLGRLNARIFVYVLERVPAAENGWTWTFRAAPEAPAQVVAAAPLTVDPGAAVVLTLGNLGGRILVTLTDGDPARVAELLARVEREVPADPSSPADVVLPLPDPYLSENGRTGIALLPPSATRFFPKLPDAVRFEEDAFAISAAVFLSPDELALARASGIDALAERFRLAGRNIVRLGYRGR